MEDVSKNLFLRNTEVDILVIWMRTLMDDAIHVQIEIVKFWNLKRENIDCDDWKKRTLIKTAVIFWSSKTHISSQHVWYSDKCLYLLVVFRFLHIVILLIKRTFETTKISQTVSLWVNLSWNLRRTIIFGQIRKHGLTLEAHYHHQKMKKWTLCLFDHFF